jgi:hypothetical protein
MYHPDLLTFSLLAEPGYTWQQLCRGRRDEPAGQFVAERKPHGHRASS